MANEATTSIKSESIKDTHIAANAGIQRSKLAQRTNQVIAVPWEAFRVHDAYQTTLPGTALTDDLGLIGGTFGTDAPSIETEDLKAAGATTSYARCFAQIPHDYDDVETILLRLSAGMVTTVADTAATIDVEIYKSDRFGAESGDGDLVTTAAQSINSLSEADKDFVIDSSLVDPGDILDIRITVTVNDGATGTEVKARIGAVELVCDLR